MILSMRLINKNHTVKNWINMLLFLITYTKLLIILSAATGGISIISFTTANGAPVGIASASFSLIFSITTGIIKKVLDVTTNKKKKHDQVGSYVSWK